MRRKLPGELDARVTRTTEQQCWQQLIGMFQEAGEINGHNEPTHSAENVERCGPYPPKATAPGGKVLLGGLSRLKIAE